MGLDHSEKLILDQLQKNARLSNAKLAEATHLSESSCWRKTKTMEEAGIIRRYSAIVEPKKLGLNFEAIVQIILDRHHTGGTTELENILINCDEVVECLRTTGDFDFLLKVVSRDIDAYNAFMERHLFSTKTIRSMRTNVVLKSVKVNSAISPYLLP